MEQRDFRQFFENCEFYMKQFNLMRKKKKEFRAFFLKPGLKHREKV